MAYEHVNRFTYFKLVITSAVILNNSIQNIQFKTFPGDFQFSLFRSHCSSRKNQDQNVHLIRAKVLGIRNVSILLFKVKKHCFPFQSALLFLSPLNTILRGKKLNYNSVAKEISKPPVFWILKSSGHQSLTCLFDSRFL